MSANPDLPTSNLPELSARTVSSPAPLSPGQMVSKYRIVSCLGFGGMGVVYKAFDTQLQRVVALKFLPEGMSATDKERQRLLREARAASSLDHSNLGVVYDVEESPSGELFLSMGFYDGETLSQRMQRGAMSVPESVGIARQIACGLEYAHEHHVIHGDIKPSNILITAEGVVKIVDFGLARKTSATAATQTGGIGGTVGYVSPEQMLDKSVDQRSDIWSLGVVFFQMLTAETPFRRESAGNTLLAILNEPPANMHLVPENIRPIIYRALAKSPTQRYPNCREFLHDLNTLDSEVPLARAPRDLKRVVEAASHTTLTLPGLPSRPRWWIGVAVAVLLVLAMLFLPIIRNTIFPDTTEKHIVVLPFDIKGDGGTQILSDGLMDTLTSRLSNLDDGQQSLWVVPSTEVRRRKISDPVAAQKEFGATLVVTGSIVRDARNVQLTLNLIDPRKMRQVGSAVLNDSDGDFSSLEQEAVSRLARLMRVRLTPDILRAEDNKPSPAAYELYLKGLGNLQRWDKPANLDAAITLFTQAIETDSKFALAYASLGESFRLKFKSDADPKWMDQAAHYCRRAAELNSQLPAVHVTLGRVHAETGQNDLALQEFQQALKLDSRNADAMLGMAGVYERGGRIKEAEVVFQRASALRPDYWDGFSKLGAFYYRQQRFADAERQYRRVVELTPDNAQAYSNLAVMLQNQKKYQEAEATFKKSIALNPSYVAYTNLGNLYWEQNRFADCAAMTEKALELNDKDYRTWGNLALAYEWLNEKAKAENASRRELELVEALSALKPEDPALQSELAILYAKLGNREKAISRIQSALARAPENERILIDAGETYENLGNRKKAIGYVQGAIKHGWPLEEVKRNPALRNLVSDPGFRAP